MKKLLVVMFLGIASLLTACSPSNMASFMPDPDLSALPESCEANKLMGMIKCKLAEDVTMDDAVDSMKLRANTENFKLVAHMPLSEQVKAMGEESARMEIFQFCDALIAKKMVEHDKIFAGFLPCRISMVEDADGGAWLITMNMDLMITMAELTPELEELGKSVRDKIYSIVSAGVTGDL